MSAPSVSAFGGAFAGDRAVAGGDDSFEGTFLVRGVAFYGFDEVGNQIVATLQLDVDIGPGVIALYLEADQAVVHRNNNEDQEHENDCDSDQHGAPPRFAGMNIRRGCLRSGYGGIAAE